MGYGTGLISYLSYLYHSPSPINYTAIEAYPLSQDEIKLLNYSQCISSEKPHTFDEFSKLAWGQHHKLDPNFNFEIYIRFQCNYDKARISQSFVRFEIISNNIFKLPLRTQEKKFLVLEKDSRSRRRSPQEWPRNVAPRC